MTRVVRWVEEDGAVTKKLGLGMTVMYTSPSRPWLTSSMWSRQSSPTFPSLS